MQFTLIEEHVKFNVSIRSTFSYVLCSIGAYQTPVQQSQWHFLNEFIE